MLSMSISYLANTLMYYASRCIPGISFLHKVLILVSNWKFTIYLSIHSFNYFCFLLFINQLIKPYFHIHLVWHLVFSIMLLMWLKWFCCNNNSLTVHYPAYYMITYRINIDLSFNYFSMSDGDHIEVFTLS